jgi:hypothetical protein
MHGGIVITLTVQDNYQVCSGMDVLLEIGSRWGFVGYRATKTLHAFVYLSQLEIGYAPVTVGTYLRQFSGICQTVGDGEEVIKVAGKPGCQRNAVAMGAHHCFRDVTETPAVFSLAARNQQDCHRNKYNVV